MIDTIITMCCFLVGCWHQQLGVPGHSAQLRVGLTLGNPLLVWFSKDTNKPPAFEKPFLRVSFLYFVSSANVAWVSASSLSSLAFCSAMLAFSCRRVAMNLPFLQLPSCSGTLIEHFLEPSLGFTISLGKPSHKKGQRACHCTRGCH